MAKNEKLARRFVVRGRVQGVGFRYFTERAANALGVRGYVRNLDNGNVEVYAAGSSEQLTELAGMLRKGPHLSEVTGVDESEAAVEDYSGFRAES